MWKKKENLFHHPSNVYCKITFVICPLKSMVKITAKEQDKEKRMKRIEDSLRDLWDNMKCTNIWIIGVPKEEEKNKGTEKIFEESIAENFPNQGKETDLQVQEAQRVPNKMDSKRSITRQSIIQMVKDKEKT